MIKPFNMKNFFISIGPFYLHAHLEGEESSHGLLLVNKPANFEQLETWWREEHLFVNGEGEFVIDLIIPAPNEQPTDVAHLDEVSLNTVNDLMNQAADVTEVQLGGPTAEFWEKMLMQVAFNRNVTQFDTIKISKSNVVPKDIMMVRRRDGTFDIVPLTAMGAVTLRGPEA